MSLNSLLKSLDQAYSTETTSLRVKMESIIAQVQRGKFFDSSIGKGGLLFDFSAVTKDFARKLTLLKMKSKLNGEQEVVVTEKILSIGGNFSVQCRQMISTIETVLIQAGKDYLNAAFDSIKNEVKQVPSSVSIEAEEVTEEMNQKLQNVHNGIQKILSTDETPAQAANDIDSEYSMLKEKMEVFLQKRAYNNNFRNGKASKVPDMSEFPVSQKDLEKFISESVKELRKEMISVIEKLVISRRKKVDYRFQETMFCLGFCKQDMIVPLNEKYQACLDKLTKRAKCTKNSNLGTKLDNLFQNACRDVTSEADSLYQETRDREIQQLVVLLVDHASHDMDIYVKSMNPKNYDSIKEAKDEVFDLWNLNVDDQRKWLMDKSKGWDFASTDEQSACTRKFDDQIALRRNESLTRVHILLDKKSPTKKRVTSSVSAPAPAPAVPNKAGRKTVKVKPTATAAAIAVVEAEDRSPVKRFRSESSASKKRRQRTPVSDASTSVTNPKKDTPDNSMEVEEMDPVKAAKLEAAAALQKSANAFAAKIRKGKK